MPLSEHLHCEMKISPATLTNKKCLSHQRLWPPNGNEGFQSCDAGDAATPRMTAEEPGDARSSPLAPLRWTGKQGWHQNGRWGASERDEVSEPRGLQLPLYRMLIPSSDKWSLMFSLPFSGHYLLYLFIRYDFCGIRASLLFLLPPLSMTNLFNFPQNHHMFESKTLKSILITETTLLTSKPA